MRLSHKTGSSLTVLSVSTVRLMFVRVRDLDCHVQLSGAADAPRLVLLHSLGTNLHVWDAQAEALSDSFRVIGPDLRGHGLTSVTPGPYSIAEMAQDVLALLDALEITAAHVAGLSIGGLIAQSLAAQAPERLRSLVLCDTAMSIPPPENWRNRAAAVRRDGMAPVVEGVVARWITDGFQNDVAAHGLRAMLRRTDPEGYAGSAEAIADCDLSATTRQIKLPTLVIVGDQDVATPPAAAEAMRDAIAGATLIVLPGLSHIPTVQGPDAVTGAMKSFLQGLDA